jgi:hypothetical protein
LIDRKTAAALVSAHVFPTYSRAFETYPVKWANVAGHAMAPAAELLRVAFSLAIAGGPSLSKRPRKVVESRQPEIAETVA